MKSGWFGPKTLGWGVTVTSWKGFAASLAFVVVAAGIGYLVPQPVMGWMLWTLLVAYLAMAKITYRGRTPS